MAVLAVVALEVTHCMVIYEANIAPICLTVAVSGRLLLADVLLFFRHCLAAATNQIHGVVVWRRLSSLLITG